MLVDCDRVPLFTSAGDDKLELAFVSLRTQACSEASDDVCADARMRHPALRLPWMRAHLARLRPAFPSPLPLLAVYVSQCS
jgi:hypothetical protein